MAKIVLGKRPEKIVLDLSIPLAGGDKGALKLDCKYMTKSEYLAYAESLIKDRQAKMKERREQLERSLEEGDDLPAESAVEMYGEGLATDAAALLNFIVGWNLDEELSITNMKQLLDEVPAAGEAISEAYAEMCMRGARRGN